jgi:hypothetical protein
MTRLMIDVEAVQERQRDRDCRFRANVTTAQWAISYETEIKDPILNAAAEILLADYVPKPRTVYCHVSYSQGDDNLYPIV